MNILLHGLHRQRSLLVPVQLDGSESVQRTRRTICSSVSPGEISAEAPSTNEMTGIIRPIEGASFHGAEMCLDEIQPTGVRRHGDHCDAVCPIESPQIGMPMSVEIVHDHIQALPSRVAHAEPPEGSEDISGRFPTPTGPHQTVRMDHRRSPGTARCPGCG